MEENEEINETQKRTRSLTSDDEDKNSSRKKHYRVSSEIDSDVENQSLTKNDDYRGIYIYIKINQLPITNYVLYF